MSTGFRGAIRLDTFAEENRLESQRVTPGLTLLEFFDADISGRDFAQGKPHPEIFLTGAKELGVPPQECLVVEDAVTGIQAAKAGGMAALGLSRTGDEELLAAAQPDVLVTSLDDVDLAALAEGRLVQRGAYSAVRLTADRERVSDGRAARRGLRRRRRAPRVPRRADRCDARSGDRSPLAGSVT